MSKIVCDVCGSSYSETENQCPICGTAKTETVKPVIETTGEEQAAKGGKFSAPTRRTSPARQSGSESKSGRNQATPSNTAMIAIVGVLLLAIIAVVVILIANGSSPDPTIPTGNPDTTGFSNTVVKLEGVALKDESQSTLSFTAKDQSATLSVKPMPDNTTESVTYTFITSDPTVATVDQNGKVTSVGNGTAVITVTAESASKKCSMDVNVSCIVELVLNRSEFTLDATTSLTHNLYSGKLDPAQITWESSDPTIATVENGIVTAVKDGKVTITATIGQFKESCTVTVRNMSKISDYALITIYSKQENGNYVSEATMKIGEKQEIYLINKKTGEIIKENVQWSYSKQFSMCCDQEASTKGIMVTAKAATSTSNGITGGYVLVKAEYEGKTYEFKIRVDSTAATN